MIPEMNEFIELLESELGYSEGANAYTKFGKWYGKNIEFDADYTAAPWCDMFLSWAAHKLGNEEWMGQFAWTVEHARWFKDQDAWGTKPQPGAFVFYDWSGSNSIRGIDHVGVVTRVEGGRIHTIEGNIDGGVAKRKVRETDKVVGYGYPWKIKARLDEEAAQREADEAAARTATSGTELGTGRDQLSTLIPHAERGQETKEAARPQLPAQPKAHQAEVPSGRAKTSGRDAASPAPSTASAGSAAKTGSTGSTGSTAKSGKHAKHSAADTSAITTGPLPVIVDASASSPTPALGSPALVTSALVAALAVLAITKTRTLRLRPAAVAAAPAVAAATMKTTAKASVPSHRRRKPRKTAAPTRAVATARTPVLDAAQAPGNSPAAELFTAGGPRLTVVEIAATPNRPLRDPLEPITALRRNSIEPIAERGRQSAIEPITALRSLRGIPLFEPIVIPEATSAFDAFSPIPVPATPRSPYYRARPVQGAAASPAPGSFFRSSPVPAASAGIDPYTPVPEPVRGHEPSTSISVSSRGVVAGSPSRREHPGGSYCGRRRRHEHPIEEPAGFVTDAPLRGRRHRSAPDRPFLESFAGDAPLPGHRHRAAHPAPHEHQAVTMAAASQVASMAAAGGPAPVPTSPPVPAHGARRTSGSRRGRHRA